MIDLFKPRGVHCVVDGQFGSTGKGALSAWLAEVASGDDGIWANFGGAIYSGGPNSGHTFYFGDEKHVLKQLPTFSVYLTLKHMCVPAYLSAGAVIDRGILKQEAEKYPDLPIFVHPNAAIITEDDKRMEETGTIAEVAGTRSGTGAALARKIQREPGAIAKNSLGNIAKNVVVQNHRLKPEHRPYFMEIAQGFSLGVNSQFYPKVTSRECTVMQGLADARIPPRHLARTYMAIRTFPIRVGNVDGHSSGDWYEDQREVSWDQLGVEPELTTVTQRIRRVAEFSMYQFYDACHANDPDWIFISHLDYLPILDQRTFIEDIKDAMDSRDKRCGVILSAGPKVTNVRMLEGSDAD